MSDVCAPLRYAVIGTGAIGGYYGAKLQQAGCEVHFLLRSDYEWVKTHGLSIDSIDGNFVLPSIRAYCDPAQMPPIDVAIVALKTTHNAQLLKLLPPIKPNGAVLSFQNGWEVEAAIAHQLKTIQPETIQLKTTTDSTPTILGGLCFICANKDGPGHIHHLDYGRILLGAHTDDYHICAPTPLMLQIADDFTRAQVAIEMTDDLPMARWQKLVWNVPYNGLSVVLNATTEAMMKDQAVLMLITALMNEVVAIANAWGQQHPSNTPARTQRSLPQGLIEQMLSNTEKMAPYRTSMKIDYDEGRSLELETILGNPIRTAQALGIAAPTMKMLYQQLSFLNAINTAQSTNSHQ